MEKLIILLLTAGLGSALWAQDFQHLDFLGAGHDNNITVSTSSSATEALGAKTVDGFPINNDEQLREASRFLAHASFGADFATIEMTAAMGYEAWLEEQFALPAASVTNEFYAHANTYGEVGEGSPDEPISSYFFRTAWLTNHLISPDILRQRIAFSLSQILVINDLSDLLEDHGQAVSTYYDKLSTNAFGNYLQILTDVTYDPTMGFFLSHYSNQKANPALNIQPDENYAREIMQLFSIGLWELNQNGTRKLDADGQFIPTYTNADIDEFAQVFTGLSDGSEEGDFFNELEAFSLTVPMKMYDEYHDMSEKKLLNGLVLPANQSGVDDINQTLIHLSTHPNTAPFIAKALIQFLTTSNPSPAYVKAVADEFNALEDNNLQRVISAILLHPEARSCYISPSYTFGKLREPVVRLMNFYKAFQMTPNDNGDFEFSLECYEQATGQSPLRAPSVFNFFAPSYSPPGPINQAYYVGPEFQILNSTNSIGILNDVNNRAVRKGYFEDSCIPEEEEPNEEEIDEEEWEEEDFFMDYSRVLALADSPNALVNHLDILLANGLLESDTKTIIANAVGQLDDPNSRLKMALYLILISPDYAILK